MAVGLIGRVDGDSAIELVCGVDSTAPQKLVNKRNKFVNNQFVKCAFV